MPICPGEVRSLLAVLTLVVSAGELLAQANTSYGLDTAPSSTDSANIDDKVPYGLDTVSSSGFHDEVFDRYGAEASRQGTTSEGHFRKTSPQYPGLLSLPSQDLDHVALYRAMQHLTGAVEITPGAEQGAKAPTKASASAVQVPTKPAPKSPPTRPTQTYRRWRLFGR